MLLDLEVEEYLLVDALQNANGKAALIEKFEFDEYDVLEVLSIEDLVRHAYDADPDQVRENLLDIIQAPFPEYSTDELSSAKEFMHIALYSLNTPLFLKAIKEIVEEETDWTMVFTKTEKI